MAYDLHIERSETNPIALSEWREAIEATEGVRLCAQADRVVVNPRTGETLRVRGNDGDAEAFDPDSGEWEPVFKWRGESATFSLRFDTSETQHPIWKAAVSLATSLGAVICGDEGEVYDFKTGEAVDD